MKLVILGGGPGGYVCAIRAAQLGAQVVLIEEESIGGTCLNWGCIPTKVLLHTTEEYDLLKRSSGDLGIIVGDIKLDWLGLQNRKSLVVQQLVGGVRTVLNSYGVQVLKGKGKFISDDSIEVTGLEVGRKIIQFDKAVVATGSIPVIPPIPGLKLPGVITSKEALELFEPPSRLCIIGGGVIGVEFADIFARSGSEVTILEMLPRLVVNMDEETVDCLEQAFVGKGIKIYKDTKVESVEQISSGLRINSLRGDESIIVEADKVLVATGRSPNGQGLGLEDIGVEVKKGAVLVDRLFKTSNEKIYAIGDCTGGVQLAHVASASGNFVAELLLGHGSEVDFRTTPYCVYTKPELAGVGLTEEEARKTRRISVGKFPLYANGKSVIVGEVEGFVKIVADAVTGEVLGIHIAGRSATELISFGALSIRLESTVEELLTTIYAHPTVGEALHEAAEDVIGKPIHIP